MKKAFTIIETLVAITILMIAISGPLTVAFKALTAAASARDQMTASLLAQDAIEYIRNVKDSNVIKAADPANEGIGFIDGFGQCNKNNMCDVDTFTNTINNDCTSFTDADCNLYQNTTTHLYTHTGGSGTSISPYKRFVYLKNITATSSQVVVDVIWKTGTYAPASTTLKTDLYDVTK